MDGLEEDYHQSFIPTETILIKNHAAFLLEMMKKITVNLLFLGLARMGVSLGCSFTSTSSARRSRHVL